MTTPNKEGEEATEKEFFKKPSYVASWFSKPNEQSKTTQTEEKQEELENIDINTLKNVVVYASENELGDSSIVYVLNVKTVYNKKGNPKLLIRYQKDNKIYSIFYSKSFLIAIANNLNNEIKTFKELEGKKVILKKHSVYIGKTVITHLIPIKIFK